MSVLDRSSSRRLITFAATLVALVAFAGNSILCRLALGQGSIDAASFTQLRLLSGGLMLLVLCAATQRVGAIRSELRLVPSLALFGYAAAFSFAYLSLQTGTGALLLFGAVQLTMLGTALARGERLGRVQWLGVVAASGGLVLLVAPGLHAPDPSGAALMLVAGAAWGVYTLAGKGGGDPVVRTAANFLGTIPLVALLLVLTGNLPDLSSRGVVLAISSGAITSALGYAIWYRALRGLGTATAAAVQLSVPVIAAYGGLLWMEEPLTWRLAAAAGLTLGGIGLVARAHAAVPRHCYRYPLPAVTVDVVLLARDGDQRVCFVAIERGDDPHRGAWALPGGFVDVGAGHRPEADQGESLLAAAIRELREETSIDAVAQGIALLEVGAFGEPHRDPRGRVIAVAFVGVASSDVALTLQAGDDAADARWVPLDELPPPTLAFDHALMLRRALIRLLDLLAVDPRVVTPLFDGSFRRAQLLDLLTTLRTAATTPHVGSEPAVARDHPSPATLLQRWFDDGFLAADHTDSNELRFAPSPTGPGFTPPR